MSAALETLEGENLKRVPDVGRASKRAALAAAGLSKTEGVCEARAGRNSCAPALAISVSVRICSSEFRRTESDGLRSCCALARAPR